MLFTGAPGALYGDLKICSYVASDQLEGRGAAHCLGGSPMRLRLRLRLPGHMFIGLYA